MPEHVVREHVPWWTLMTLLLVLLAMLALGTAITKGLREGDERQFQLDPRQWQRE